MFRRRKRPVVWLPPAPDGRLIGSIAVPSQTAIGSATLTVTGGGTGVGAAASVPLFGDYNEEVIAGSLGFSLADKQVNYFLRRVVGKLFCQIWQQDNQDAEATSTVMCTAGIIVRKVDQLGSPTSLDVFPTSYENSQDPYIWRRNWVLTNYLAKSPATVKVWSFPTMNADYGSVMDGPHVDAKTARRVGAEERLFLDLEATAIDGTPEGVGANEIHWLWDLRGLATITMNAGNRRNAAR